MIESETRKLTQRAPRGNLTGQAASRWAAEND